MSPLLDSHTRAMGRDVYCTADVSTSNQPKGCLLALSKTEMNIDLLGTCPPRDQDVISSSPHHALMIICGCECFHRIITHSCTKILPMCIDMQNCRRADA